MIAHQLPQARPVEPAAGAVQDVYDVGAVEALAEIDEQFGGDQLFGGQHPGRNSEYHSVRPAIDPRLVDHDNGIAHAGDQVNVVAVAMRLGQPDWIANLGLEAFFLQKPQGFRYSCRAQE